MDPSQGKAPPEDESDPTVRRSAPKPEGGSPPPPPRSRLGRPAAAESLVPPVVRELLVRGLSADKQQRYPSLDVLLSELEKATAQPIRPRSRIPLIAAIALSFTAIAFGVVKWGRSGSGPASTKGKTGPSSPLHTGPIRLAVLPFKNVGNEAQLRSLEEGISEGIVTDFGDLPNVRLIERGQLKLDLQELDFEQDKYVHPATRAEIGKIAGAEAVLMGRFQRVGNVVRANARFVNVEAREVVAAVRVERSLDQLLDLQDALAAEVKKEAGKLQEKLRP